MFGLLVSGRLPLYNFQRVSDTQFLIQVPDIESSGNHIVVYMTGEIPFPEGFAGAVYFNYQVDGNEAFWIYLGKITNTKPSSIFRITNLKHEPLHSQNITFGAITPVHHSTAMVGISVEPISVIEALTPATEAQPTTNINSFGEFTQKMLENFYNYASSFAKDSPDGNQYIPLAVLQTWFENFKRRLAINPNFWKS